MFEGRLNNDHMSTSCDRGSERRGWSESTCFSRGCTNVIYSCKYENESMPSISLQRSVSWVVCDRERVQTQMVRRLLTRTRDEHVGCDWCKDDERRHGTCFRFPFMARYVTVDQREQCSFDEHTSPQLDKASEGHVSRMHGDARF